MGKYWSIIVRTALGGMSNNISKYSVMVLPTYYYVLFRQMGLLLITSVTKGSNIKKDIFTVLRNPRQRNLIVFSGILTGIGSMLYYLAVYELPISVISLIDNVSYILFSTLIAVVFFRERRSTKFYMLMVLLFPAMYLIMFKDLGSTFSLSVVGVIALVSNAFLSAAESHITKSQLKELSISGVVFMKSVITIVIAAACIFLFDNKWSDVVANFTWIVGIVLVYSIVNTYLIKMLNTKAIKDIGVVHASMFTMLTPVFGIIFAMVLFGEWLSFTQWLGVIGIILILYFIKE